MAEVGIVLPAYLFLNFVMAKLLFVINTIKTDKNRADLLKKTIEYLMPFPTSQILVIDDSYSQLKRSCFGGRWTHRYLSEAINFYSGKEWDYLIKVDPDTFILRPLENCTPKELDYFGNFVTRESLPYIHGGCKGFSRRLVEFLVKSNALLDSLYCENQKFTYTRYKGRHLRPGELASSYKISCQDLITFDVINNLKGFNCGHWPEAEGSINFADWKDRSKKLEIKDHYAVIHPIEAYHHARSPYLNYYSQLQ